MEFSKHIGKGLWAIADKSLPAIYGIGFIFLVIRVLPEKEFGAFVVIQTIYTLIMALGYALAFQPLTKFAAENDQNDEYVSSSVVMGLVFFIVAAILVQASKPFLIPLLDKNKDSLLDPLFIFLPFLFLSAFYRSLAISFLQAKYKVQKIFWIDAAYLLVTLVLIYLAQHHDRFSKASDLLILLIVTQAFSSILALTLTIGEMPIKIFPKWETIRKFWDYGKYSFTVNTFYNIFAHMDTFFISAFVGIYFVAIYNAAKVLTRLFDMLSQVLMMFLIPFSSKSFSQNDVNKLTIVAEKSICFSTILFIPVFIAMFFFPEQLLHILYKDKYLEGANVIRIFSFLALAIPWNSVASSYMAGIGRVKESFYLSLGLLFLSLLGYSILTPPFGMLGTTITYVACLIILTIAVSLYIRKFVPYRLVGIIGRIRDIKSFLVFKTPFKFK